MGVPLIAPFKGSMVSPEGSAGLTVYEEVAPETNGISGVSASPTVARMGVRA